MTRESQQALDEAEAAHEQDTRTARTAQEALLGAVADRVGETVDLLARDVISHDVAQARLLGKEGMSTLRDAMRGPAEAVAARVRSSADIASWPQRIGTFGSTHAVRQAVRQLFDRVTLNELSAPLSKAGFAVYIGIFDAASFVPESAFEAEVLAVHEALRVENISLDRVRNAKAEHDNADLDDLWPQ